MAFSLFSSKNRIINLVINDHSIRYLELKQANPPIAQKWGERFLPPGIISDGKIIDIDSLTNILEECIDEWKIHRRPIRFIVPDQFVIIRKITVPADIQDDEMKGYLYLELGSTIHLPFDEPVLDYHPLSDNGKTKEILLFAAPEQQVEEYANLFSGLKLNPVAADISSLALYRLFHHLGAVGEKETILSVQFDLTSVNLCIFDGKSPVVMRPFELSFDMDNWNIKQDPSGLVVCKYIGEASELSLQLEDIYREINKLIDFYKYNLNNGSSDMAKFLLNGDHPMLSTIAEEIKDRFEIPVKIIKSDEKLEFLPGSLLLSLGLALKGVQ